MTAPNEPNAVDPSARPPALRRPSFGEDFKRFFTRGLATVLPTLITLSLVVWVWNFLWEAIGQHIIWLVKWVWLELVQAGLFRFEPANHIGWYWDTELHPFRTHLLGVTLAVLLVYVVGVFVGNLIGRTAWRLAERGVMRLPMVRAIYPAVKQVTDFILADRTHHFSGSRVVAVQPHEQGIWQIGLVTAYGEWSLNRAGAEEMVSVFLPSTPTAFSGYVMLVPRANVVELPMTVEEALRLLVSGGVIMPGAGKTHRTDLPAGTPATAAIPAMSDLGAASPRGRGVEGSPADAGSAVAGVR